MLWHCSSIATASHAWDSGARQHVYAPHAPVVCVEHICSSMLLASHRYLMNCAASQVPCLMLHVVAILVQVEGVPTTTGILQRVQLTDNRAEAFTP